MKTEPAAPVEDETKQEPVIAAGSTGGPSAEHDNGQYKQEYQEDFKQDPGNDHMDAMQEYGHAQREERPIGIKEDGYVFPFPRDTVM